MEITLDTSNLATSGTVLTPHQEIAYQEISDFVYRKSTHKMHVLSGYAGTGKSTLTNHLLADLLNNTGKTIAVTAPTNKAVKVLRNMSKYLPQFSHRIRYKTIHSLLGLKEVIDHKGEIKYVADKMSSKDIDQINILIVDESSMLQDELFEEIQLYTMQGLIVLFVGDDKQIPPVKADSSIPFTAEERGRYKMQMSTLSEIVRQASDNPIIAIATSLRERPNLRKSVLTLLEGEGVVQGSGVYQISDYSDFSTVVEKLYLGNKYKEDSDFVKLIAWTNKEVDRLNNFVRTKLYPENSHKRIVVGERLLADKPILDRMETEETILFTTNDEFTVLDYQEASVNIGGIIFKTYNCQVASKDEEAVTIRVLHEDSMEEFKTVQDSLKKIAAQATKAQDSTASKRWKEYYDFDKNFAQIKYAYAITSHKCIPTDSKVITPLGIKTIGELSVGDAVISGTGKPRKVLHTTLPESKQEYIIRTRSGRVFKSSEDHRYLMPDTTYRIAKDISIGEHLCLHRGKVTESIVIDNDYYTYGYLVGDGCYSYKSNRVDITLLPETTTIDILKNFMSKYGAKVYTYGRKGNRAITLSVEQKRLRDALLEVGFSRVTRERKQTPKLTTLSQKVSYIRGLMDSDGCCDTKKASIRFVNISENIVDDLVLLLQEVGIIGHKKYFTNGKFSNYVVAIYGSDCIKYRDTIGFGIAYKQERLEKVCSLVKGKTNVDVVPSYLGIQDVLRGLIRTTQKMYAKLNTNKAIPELKDRKLTAYLTHKNMSYHHTRSICEFLVSRGVAIPERVKNILDANYYYDEVVSVEATESYVDMIDIEVEHDNTFIYNGAIVHNCQGSTYKNAIVMEYDISLNPTLIEKNRILYTAITRASKRLFVVPTQISFTRLR